MGTTKATRLPVLAAYTVPADGRYALPAQITLVRVFALLQKQMARLLADFDLTFPHFEVLARLSAGEGLTQQDVARDLLVTKGNICVIIDSLENSGLVARKADEIDRRANRLYLTPKGRALISKVLPAHRALADRLMAGIPPAAQKSLYESLAQLEATLHGLLQDETTA